MRTCQLSFQPVCFVSPSWNKHCNSKLLFCWYTVLSMPSWAIPSVFDMYHNYLGFREFAKYGDDADLLLLLGTKSEKVFSFRGFAPWSPDQGLCPWNPLGAVPPDPYYKLTLCALTMRVHPTFFDLATPLCAVIKQAVCAFQFVCKHVELKHIATFPQLWVFQRFKTAKVTFGLT